VEAPTVALPHPPARDRRGLFYGLIAFLCVAGAGGAGGYFYLQRQGQWLPEPVAIERAPAVEQAAAKLAAPEKPVEAAPPAEPAKAPDPQAASPKPPETAQPQPALAQPQQTQPPQPDPAPAAQAPPAQAAATPAQSAAVPAAAPAIPVAVASPAPEPADQAPRPVSPKVRPRRPVPAQVPESMAVAAKGELVLLIRPWAKVEVDGRDVGVTPLNEPLMLAAGDHVVRLVNRELGKDITRTVHVPPSGREVLKEILDE
jgi:serine/threonine-protein kinase